MPTSVVDAQPARVTPEGRHAFDTQDLETVHQPLVNTANTQGQYAQTIDATQLSEGYHYLSVVAFRARAANEDPLFREFRQVVYIDRTCPSILVSGPTTTTSSSVALTVKALDRTLNNGFFDVPSSTTFSVHFVVNPFGGIDPVTLASGSNQANRNDRFQWSGNVTGLLHGNNRVAVCTFEETGRGCSQFYNIFVNLCVADVDNGNGTGTPDGGVGIEDLLYYLSAYDAGLVSADVDDGSGTNTRDGGVGIEDLLYFLTRYDAGC